ncbi:uncharacterized protein LOC105694316 [Orussus abietinus]|uniref:uncharacterized protein LOC105694316 n=1 Tax=Orussus abietinus TaxID=222816 RepID=UPI000C715FDD|nr:uncharacterized protein LOC105694316 [Orussus abietinus]
MLTCRGLLIAAAIAATAPASLPGPPGSPAPPAAPGACRLSEYPCTNGRCVAQDRFCDGEDDCADKSDEPEYCSPCNRTLYGDVGRTYEVEVRRPREHQLPFLCHLNFTAAGGDLGDLVQLTFDAFTVGRFDSYTAEGCPDGYVTIREAGLPATGGQWCGSAWGYTVYYSETPSIDLALYVSRLFEQGMEYNFDLKLSYKFLRRGEAHLRYGNSSLPIWRGELVNGTYCDRVLTRCDERACRVQSPNYPGVYPRNVTCYYRIEQPRAPPGHRALLAVGQRNGHKIHIKDRVVKYDRSQRVLKVWGQCNIVQDYLTIYDGGSTTDRVLVRLCGGDAVPNIISSRGTMLLEFHTSPFDNPFHPVPLSFLPGFELEVQVLFVDERPHGLAKGADDCDLYVLSSEKSAGVLENPKHSLPPNTTCRYHFQGRPGEVVWISFVKYHAAAADPAVGLDGSGDCGARLLIWDGDPAEANETRKNATLMGRFCKDDVPRLCDHGLLRNGSHLARPCSLAESYVSSGRRLTLEHALRQGSALYPVGFALRYEFVEEPAPCDRVFRPGPGPGGASLTFGSPRSVFLFQRGGARNLSCVYRFEPRAEQRLELWIVRASFGGRACATRLDPLVGRWTCLREDRHEGVAELVVAELPWEGVRLGRACLCSNLTERLPVRPLAAGAVEVRFTISLMAGGQDYRDFFFEGEYRFVAAGGGAGGAGCSRARLEERRLRGTSGEISLRGPLPGLAAVEEVLAESEDLSATRCVAEPWLIEPEDPRGGFLYLRTAGYALGAEAEGCPTSNRIVVYWAADTAERTVVCPETGARRAVDFFSPGWNLSAGAPDGQAVLHRHARSFVVEFLQREPGFHAVTWMAISRRRAPLAAAPGPEECPYRCPEIQACISPVLWCDGVRHCPSGFDEDSGCSYRFGVTLLYVAVAAGALGVFLVLLLATGCLKYCLYRHRARKRRKRKGVAVAVAVDANHHHHHHLHHPATHHHHHRDNGLAGRYGDMYLEAHGKDDINCNKIIFFWAFILHPWVSSTRFKVFLEDAANETAVSSVQAELSGEDLDFVDSKLSRSSSTNAWNVEENNAEEMVTPRSTDFSGNEFNVGLSTENVSLDDGVGDCAESTFVSTSKKIVDIRDKEEEVSNISQKNDDELKKKLSISGNESREDLLEKPDQEKKSESLKKSSANCPTEQESNAMENPAGLEESLFISRTQGSGDKTDPGPLRLPLSILEEFGATCKKEIEFKKALNQSKRPVFKCLFAGCTVEACGNSESITKNEAAARMLKFLAGKQMDDESIPGIPPFAIEQMTEIVSFMEETSDTPVRELYKLCLKNRVKEPVYTIQKETVPVGFRVTCQALQLTAEAHGKREVSARNSAASSLLEKYKKLQEA